MNGKAVLSCLTIAAKADGAEIQTIEGLATEGGLHPIQETFSHRGAVQCGFCIPGMIMNVKAFLEENPQRAEEDLRRALGGNICRCTGYAKQVEAMIKAKNEIMLGDRDSR